MLATASIKSRAEKIIRDEAEGLPLKNSSKLRINRTQKEIVGVGGLFYEMSTITTLS